MSFACFSADTTAVNEVVEVVTQYSDKRVPAINFVMIATSIVLLLAFLIVSFIVLRNRTHHWGTGLIVGITAYLVRYLSYFLMVIGVEFIAPVSAFAIAHQKLIQLVIAVVLMIVQGLVLYFGMLYVYRQSGKWNQPMDISTPLAFGVGYLTAWVLVGQEISYFFNEFQNCITINSAGFDKTISFMLETERYTEESAIQALLAIVDQNAFYYIMDSLSTVMTAVQVTCIVVVFYAVLTGKVNKKWGAYGLGFVVLSNLYGIASVFVKIMGILFVLCIAVTAVIVYFTISLVKANCTDDIRMLSYTRRMQEKDEENRKKKMPKIVMPKD